MSFRIDEHNKRKDMLWKKDKTTWEIMKINSRVAWRRFDTQMRGMGLFFVIIIVAMSIMPLATYISAEVKQYQEAEKYKSALVLACVNNEFYSWHFTQCEDIGIRPNQYNGELKQT